MTEELRSAHLARLTRAKRIAAALQESLNAPAAAMMPGPMRAALGDLSILLVDLAQLSHGPFDTAPFDLVALTHRVDALEGLTGDGGGMPQVLKRLSVLERRGAL